MNKNRQERFIMKLHIAFDLLDLEKCIQIARIAQPHVDRFEIRASLLYAYGIHAIEVFKKEFPDTELFVDTKIVNHGKELSNLAFQAGADIISVMAGAPEHFIHAVCNHSHDQKKKVLLDLLDTSLVGQAALMASSLRVDGIIFYQTPEENQGYAPSEKWQSVEENSTVPIFIGSNITRNNIDGVLALNPAGITLGKAITQAQDPLAEILYFIEKIKEHKK